MQSHPLDRPDSWAAIEVLTHQLQHLRLAGEVPPGHPRVWPRARNDAEDAQGRPDPQHPRARNNAAASKVGRNMLRAAP